MKKLSEKQALFNLGQCKGVDLDLELKTISCPQQIENNENILFLRQNGDKIQLKIF
ncbi:hypothetical protein [Mesohalobacter salilacus]|uniref:hypothetical protein n=1 Tax=Mesohalobacter salilacus TaxID=2491711 RepID=UPI0026AE537D